MEKEKVIDMGKFLVLVFLSLAQIHVFGEDVTKGPYPNSYLYGGHIMCIGGYKKVGNSCQKIIPPENGVVVGNSWACQNGYREVGNSCQLIPEISSHMEVRSLDGDCSSKPEPKPIECLEAFAPLPPYPAKQTSRKTQPVYIERNSNKNSSNHSGFFGYKDDHSWISSGEPDERSPSFKHYDKLCTVRGHWREGRYIQEYKRRCK